MVVSRKSNVLDYINQERRMQSDAPFDGFAGLNNNDSDAMNANLNNNYNDVVIGFQDRDEEFPEVEDCAAGHGLPVPINDASDGAMMLNPAGQGCYLNKVNHAYTTGYTNNTSALNSVPNFTFTTPTQSAMYSPPLMSSNQRYQLQRATPHTFSPTGCAPWQHSVPNRIPWVGQSIGMTVSSQGVSIFTAPLCSRSQISWTNTVPHAAATHDPSPSCSQIPRRPKRAATGNLEHLIPTSKVHLTERMIADHMKELSLNNIAWSPAGNNSMLEGLNVIGRGNQSIQPSQFTCINQGTIPPEASRGLTNDIQWQAFRDLEERLELSDEESAENPKASHRKPEPKVVFLENIPQHPSSDVIPQKILDNFKKPSLEVVLWQPPADVVKDVLNRRPEKEDQDGQQSQEINNQLFTSKEDDFSMDLDLCDADDMML